MGANGSGERRLTDAEGELERTESPFFQVEPAWSADGTKIAFVSGRSGSADIYVMNADGSGTRDGSPPRRRTTRTRPGSRPASGSRSRGTARSTSSTADGGAPDEDLGRPRRGVGPGVVARRRVDRVRPQDARHGDPERLGHACRTAPSGRALTRQDGRAFTPAWSPDSTRIVFSTNAESDEAYELFTVGLDGKGLRRVAPDGRRQLRAVLVARRREDRLPGGGRDLHRRARRRRGREADRRRRQRLSPAWNLAAGSDGRLAPIPREIPKASVAREACRSAAVAQNVPKRSYASSGDMPSRTATRISLSVAAFRSASTSTSSAIVVRDDHDAVVVSDDPVARLDSHAPIVTGTCVASSSQRHVESSGVTKRVEDGKALVEDEADVAAAAVEHAAGDATCLQRRDRELAEVRRDVVVAGVHGDVLRQARRRASASTLRIAASYDAASGLDAGPPLTVYAGPASRVPRSSGRIVGGSVCVVEPARVEDVRERGRVDRGEALPHGSGIPRSAGRSSPRPSTSSGARSSSRRRTSSARRTRSRPSFTARSSRWSPDG